MTTRVRLIIQGTVQGVGFRPFVYGLALKHNIKGWVQNCPEGVVIEAQSAPDNIRLFIADIGDKKPPSARIEKISQEKTDPQNSETFEIRRSAQSGRMSAVIPADLAICPDCARDISDENNRRYKYPFANCTNCGPRFTIVNSVPYDRPKTAMKGFKMCADCQAEFDNPSDRRFHAQPNCCAVCGPKVKLLYNGSEFRETAAVAKVAELIAEGKIIAVKSLGGFHFACSASSEGAMMRLRDKKSRPHKPFALMSANIEEIEKYCFVSDAEKTVLTSSRAPVVMLKKRDKDMLSLVSPNLSTIGFMTAYTPLHLALFSELKSISFSAPLVMTSANLKDEPIAVDEKDLFPVYDAVLTHNRPIYNRCDDSVVFVENGEAIPVRRARGYVPDPLDLGITGAPVMACGADLKNTFCLTRGNNAFISQYIGDMDNVQSEDFFVSAFEKMKKLLGVEPQIFACDANADFFANKFAKKSGKNIIEVQHHLAHAYSVMAEHKLKEPVIAAVLDGTGLGADGAVWGFEFFIIDGVKWERAGTLKHTALIGGDRASVEIWRLALAWAKEIYGENLGAAAKFFGGIERGAVNSALSMLKAGVNCPPASSAGRLFDAAAFFAFAKNAVSYEAQAAMELESVCPALKFENRFETAEHSGITTIDPRGFFKEIIEGDYTAPEIAEKFHSAVCLSVGDVVEKISARTGVKKAVISGGAFQNRILLSNTRELLRRCAVEAFHNRLAPANDGGISLGQAYRALLTG